MKKTGWYSASQYPTFNSQNRTRRLDLKTQRLICVRLRLCLQHSLTFGQLLLLPMTFPTKARTRFRGRAKARPRPRYVFECRETGKNEKRNYNYWILEPKRPPRNYTNCLPHYEMPQRRKLFLSILAVFFYFPRNP